MVIGEGLRLALADLTPEHPARESLKEVEKAVLHGASLTRQMLTFSGKHESSRNLVKLDRVVAETLGLLRATIPRTLRSRPGSTRRRLRSWLTPPSSSRW